MLHAVRLLQSTYCNCTYCSHLPLIPEFFLHLSDAQFLTDGSEGRCERSRDP